MSPQIPASKFKLIITPEKIKEMVVRLGEEIEKHYPKDEPLVVVGVLKGAWMFHADLVRQLKRPVSVDFIRATSYGAGTQTSGVVRILKDIETDIRDKHVLVVEEIIDSGRTLSFIRDRLWQSGPKSVKIATLLDKKERREVPCEADFCGQIVENLFVVGYGLDWGESYRNLDGIYVVPDEVLR